MITRCVALFSVVISLFAAVTRSEDSHDGRFPVTSNLRAGVAKVDITPDVSQGLDVVWHRRKVFKVRDPLRAGVLVLDDG